MKSTGVVRRIDDLGRIVIPKEIRKTLRIKDGESLEIFLESDNIILKKYSHFDGLSDFYKSYAEAIYDGIDAQVMIVDRDKIVAISGEKKKKYLDKNISSFLDEIIQNRELVYEKEKTDVVFCLDEVEKVSYVISPIVSSSDVIGAVVIFSDKRTLDDFDIKTAYIAAKFLGKYIE